MNILLTGNLGYIGSVLGPVLEKKGHKVHGFDTDYYSGCDLYSLKKISGQTLKDIRSITQEDVEGFDAIIHLAALSNDPLGELDKRLTYEINHEASIKLAKLAKNAGVGRFIFASTQSMYGIADTIVDENSKASPITTYAKSKLLAEKDLLKLSASHFTPIIVRSSTVYGISPRMRCDIVLNNLVGWAYTTKRIKVLSDGSPWKPVVYIKDLVNAYIALLEAPSRLVGNQVFNIGETRGYQVKELADEIKKILPSCIIEYSHQHGKDSRSYRVDCEKIHRVLKNNFIIQHDVEKGIKELLDGYKKYNLDSKKFVEYFVRIEQLKKLIHDKKIDPKLNWIL